jgi:hypothetical protein
MENEVVISQLRSEGENWKQDFLTLKNETALKLETMEKDLGRAKSALHTAEHRLEMKSKELSLLEAKLEGVVECFEKLLSVVRP